MVTQHMLDDEVAIELPTREMLQVVGPITVNIAVPIIIQNNINVQVCGVGVGNTAVCTSGQTNVGGIIINWT